MVRFGRGTQSRCGSSSVAAIARRMVVWGWMGVIGAVQAGAPVWSEPPDAVVGADPRLPAPQSQLVPTVRVATAVGWVQDQKPEPADGLEVQAFARGLDHPRWIHVLPNGDVLVAEANRPGPSVSGVKGWVTQFFMKRAGAGSASADRITLLRDTNGDGVADERHVFLDGLHSPFGMALVGDRLYIANADALVSVPYAAGATQAAESPRHELALPAGRNHHWTKNVIASEDGRTLYVTVGSNSNIGENGLAEEEGRAAIWAFDRSSGKASVYASGLRNPNGLAWAPGSPQTLWTVVNERDGLGDDLVPDYLTSVKPGGFYGWPYSYWGRHVDVRVQPQRPELVAQALAPDFALGAHVAALGLSTSAGLKGWPSGFKEGMFIGEHGSWNRRTLSGYQVVFVPFHQGQPVGTPVPVLGGFVGTRGEAMGRPVGVAVDRSGGLLVADDVGNVIWRVTPEVR